MTPELSGIRKLVFGGPSARDCFRMRRHPGTKAKAQRDHIDLGAQQN